LPRLDSSRSCTTRFAPARDHPRAVAGMWALFGRAWGANFDTQWMAAPTHDLPAVIQTDAADAAAFWDSLNSYFRVLEQNPAVKDATLEIRKARAYTDLNGYLEDVTDYVAGYICKDAVSVDDVGAIFEDLVRNCEDGTSFQSLAMQMQMRVLKSRALKSTEAHWLTQKLPLVTSSFSFLAISRPGNRPVQGARPAGGDEEAGATRLGNNQWDCYMKFVNKTGKDGSFLYSGDSHPCFDTFCTAGGTKVPTWSFWSTDVVWPLASEEGQKWCRDALIRYKPVRSLEEVLGSHRTHDKAMEEFLATSVCPAGLRKQVARARLAVAFGQAKEGVRCRLKPKATRKHRTRGDRSVDGSDCESEGDDSDGDGASALFGCGATDAVGELPADLDERGRGQDVPAAWRRHLPTGDDLQDWTSRLYDSVESAEHARPLVWKVQTQDGTQWPSIHSANAKQRELLTDVLWHLHDLDAWDGDGLPPQLIGLCAGSAGTGKTFVLTPITHLYCAWLRGINPSHICTYVGFRYSSSSR
jgi:hypothetical protein